MAQVVGRTLTRLCTVCGNISSGYQQPPNRAMTMPVIMLNPLACPSVLTKVPNVVPSAAAASAPQTIMTANARGWLPQFSFMIKIPKRINNDICTSAVTT